MRIKKKKFGFELGIVLLILSLPMSQITKLVFGVMSIDISSILLCISLFLICNKTNLLRFRFPSMNKGYLLILGFLVYNILIAVYAGIGLFNANYGIIYILFTIVLIISISTNNRMINYNLLIRLFVYISGIFNLLLISYLTNESASLVPTSVNTILVNGVLVADRLTLSTMAYFYIIALLVFGSKNNFDRVFSVIFLFIALLNIIATSRRGLMVALILILLVHLLYRIRQNKLSKNTVLKTMKFGLLYSVGFIIFYLILRNIPELGTQVEAFTHRFSSSIITFFSGTNDSTLYDSASHSRVLARQRSYALLSEATMIQLLFGFGYMYKWIDFPFLQAIIDMGIFFGILYIYIQIKPILYTILKPSTLQNGELFFLFLAIVGLLNNVYSGFPYGYYKYVYLIPFIYVIQLKKREKESNIIQSSINNKQLKLRRIGH